MEAGSGTAGPSGQFAPSGPAVDGLFVIIATATLALTGVLVENGGLLGVGLVGTPVAERLPDWGATALVVWMVSVGFVALVLPALALVAWGRHASVRLALLPYVLVLAVQILVEMVFASVFVPSMVVLVGLVYTGYRLRQLLATRRAFAVTRSPTGYGRTMVRGVLSLGIVFWSANLVFLLFVALPRVVQVS